jgi:hypothetical protein
LVLAAVSIMPRVRAAAVSEMTTKAERLERSAGISVWSTHLPSA